MYCTPKYKTVNFIVCPRNIFMKLMRSLGRRSTLQNIGNMGGYVGNAGRRSRRALVMCEVFGHINLPAIGAIGITVGQIECFLFLCSLMFLKAEIPLVKDPTLKIFFVFFYLLYIQKKPINFVITSPLGVLLSSICFKIQI